jgi:hypothetical protein
MLIFNPITDLDLQHLQLQLQLSSDTDTASETDTASRLTSAKTDLTLNGFNLDFDRLPLPQPPLSFDGKPIVRIERNHHRSPLARAFLPYYLVDDKGRHYLVLAGSHRQSPQPFQFQSQIATNLFFVATTDRMPAGKILIFGNKLRLVATPSAEDTANAQPEPKPVILQFVEVEATQ